MLALMDLSLIQQCSFHVLFLIDYLKDIKGVGKERHGADDEFVNDYKDGNRNETVML